VDALEPTLAKLLEGYCALWEEAALIASEVVQERFRHFLQQVMSDQALAETQAREVSARQTKAIPTDGRPTSNTS
jgi:hypothetical protein